MFKICYVEDEVNLNLIVSKYLKAAGYEVYSYNYPKKIDFDIKYDLYILDIMFDNDINGFELLKLIKEKDENSLVIFTSARDNDVDRIKGLEMGSDDYLSKPFSPRELVIRCDKLLKRKIDNVIYQNDYKIDLDNRLVFENLTTIILTNKEYDLLFLFLSNKNKLITRNDILNKIWNEEFKGSLRVVDDLIRRLRQKMPKLGIETIYGEGYRLI